jgi:N-acetylneuraminic acid mutarotase
MRYLILLLLLPILSCTESAPPVPSSTPEVTKPTTWQAIFPVDSSAPSARHEAAFVRLGDRAYLLGGRGIKPVDILDLKTMTWTAGALSPIEIHHFQPVVYEEEIYLMGAMTGKYPGETPLPDIHIYNPTKDEWRTGATIPPDRRRGGAGTAVHNGLIYMVCGIQDGHRGGHVPWLDVYNPETNTWEQLADAPRSRDHFQAAIHGNKLYALAGRTTIAATNPFANTIGEVDVFDLASGRWSTLPDTLPTLRAGNAAMTLGDEILVVGGESDQLVAHSQVEALAVSTGKWRTLDSLCRGRHGTGIINYEGQLIMASGCGNHGGEPELADLIGLMLKE